MTNNKVGIFSAFLFVAVAALFFPATALENSVANAQEEYYPEEEYYPQDYEKENNGYYDQAYDYYPLNNEEENNGYYDQAYDYYPSEHYKQKDPIIKIKKELFVCDEVENDPNFFDCETQFGNPSGPTSGKYLECTLQRCPGIAESDFAVQIYKDVATIRDLTPQGTPVNLDKFHYSVTEEEIEDQIDFDDDCSTTGFRHELVGFAKELQDREVNYDICVKYVEDCEGTIYSGEVKTCIVKNYIYRGEIFNENGFTTTTTPSATTTTTQSNNAGAAGTTIQSSNVGVPQSSNIGAAGTTIQSSNVGVPFNQVM